MLSKEVKDLIMDQINKEFYSAYLYLEMSNYYFAKNLKGFASWFKVQTQEEVAHAMLFVSYLQKIGEEVKLEAIAAPNKVYNDIKEPLTTALSHEKYVTSLINAIYEVATQQKDADSMKVLEWFIKEQDEEERSTGSLVKRFDQYGGDPKTLESLDSTLGARSYAPPSLVL